MIYTAFNGGDNGQAPSTFYQRGPPFFLAFVVFVFLTYSLFYRSRKHVRQLKGSADLLRGWRCCEFGGPQGGWKTTVSRNGDNGVCPRENGG